MAPLVLRICPCKLYVEKQLKPLFLTITNRLNVALNKMELADRTQAVAACC
jgi:hypothetical protein